MHLIFNKFAYICPLKDNSMKLRFFLPLLLVSSCTVVPVGEAYMVENGVAVFEPEGYNPQDHTPSPIFVNQLQNKGEVDEGWEMTPRFSHVYGRVYGKLFGNTAVSFDIDGADLYGLGEAEGGLRRNFERIFFWNTDNPTGMLRKGRQMYQSHPWILGVRKDGSAFGIIADNTWRSHVSTKGRIYFVSKGPAFRVVVIEKDNPEEVVKTLARLTGKMELPPLWALGYHQCRYSYYPQERVAALADTIRARKIPCDVIWMDIHYMDSFKVFTFHPDRFSDPKALNGYLHKNNFKTVYMIDPGVKVEEGYSVYDQGLKGDYFVKDETGSDFAGKVWPGDCHFPDFTMPQARRWWAGLYKDFMAQGVDGVWNDMNEPSVFVDFGGTMPPTNVHRGGDGIPEGSHLRYHNIYGYYMVKASREGILAANPNKRPFVLSRANFLGGQRYAAMWTGDNYSDYASMKASVPMCLNMGLSGQPISGPDIGGFMRNCTPDLLRHWTASGVYFPFVRNHSCEGTAQQEPWAFDTKTEDICRRAIERRYRLLPYYYTLFEEASRTGLPVMRPVFWADFKDADLREEQQAFLVGNDLLVIPRWSESPALPKGNWELFDFENGMDDGYQSYLALRPGAAIPIIDVIQSTEDYSTKRISIIVNPDENGEAEGTLYDDAGEGFGYRDGKFARYGFKAETIDSVLTLSMEKVEGKLWDIGRSIRVGIVRGGRIYWSDWTIWNKVSVDMPEEQSKPIDAASLLFTELENGSISKKMTKAELIMQNIFN